MGEQERLQQRLLGKVKSALKRFEFLAEGDHILVCLSGGKDSYTLLDMLMALQREASFNFQITAFHLDQKQPGYPEGVLRTYLHEVGIPFEICEQDTYSVVQEKLAPEATPCSLCSRMRRGIIYRRAEALGCNVIALGHHRDDSIETLLLNLFYSGRVQGMPASYTTDDGRFRVIRPLLLAAEDEIATYASLRGFPIIPCNLCGSVEGKRKLVKRLLTELEEAIPHVRHSLLAAMGNVKPSHLLDADLAALAEAAAGAPQAQGCHEEPALF
ncbi:tRNA 2-thiocytidine(32) synthetase TtcA [Lujinxingia litoralis]|uniref:tRNA 2-thiocytidine(32) synthetase TtcA n=1 Tax=Lujinxingia litoralis TaxID=2211119 RepID=A0A328CD39_9DELT|nr:tRNA 2-thiocytidine(32) synthetase TtcA [Lujinxingia litoralis]RAL25241.1 tRNA 2-thiocytidine(32) synthetase TtcA [Lujinxingia litoralis]